MKVIILFDGFNEYVMGVFSTHAKAISYRDQVVKNYPEFSLKHCQIWEEEIDPTYIHLEKE